MYNWLLRLVCRLRPDGSSREDLSGFSGNYVSWEEASVCCTGYDDSAILAKVLDATLKVKRGEAIYERDSVNFDKIEYAWPVLAGLMWAAARNGGNLNVLDFGGSLGSSYLQNRKFLNTIPKVMWNVVEQPHYVEAGKANFQHEHLRFYNSIEECLVQNSPNVVVVSGVLQYLQHPYEVLEKLLKLHGCCLIVDRTPFWSGEDDRLGIQTISPCIFKASYPMWVFSLSKFKKNLDSSIIVEEFDGFESLFELQWKGFVISNDSAI